MKREKLRYYIINAIVLLVAVGLLVRQVIHSDEMFLSSTGGQLAIIVVTSVLVHLIKFARLSLTLYGSEMDALTASRIYCKVTFVSVLLPLKLGEFFRMYCYGKKLKNILKGIVIIILDRFMDTVALVTMVLLVWVFYGGHMTKLIYVFLIFLGAVLLLYLVFPGLYGFWKKCLLRARATEFRLAMLKVLELINSVYVETKNVSRGRGLILYFLSLIAWAVEIGSIALINRANQGSELSSSISNYLSSVMGVGNSVELTRFVLVSVILLVVTYGVIEAYVMLSRKKEL